MGNPNKTDDADDGFFPSIPRKDFFGASLEVTHVMRWTHTSLEKFSKEELLSELSRFVHLYIENHGKRAITEDQLEFFREYTKHFGKDGIYGAIRSRGRTFYSDSVVDIFLELAKKK